MRLNLEIELDWIDDELNVDETIRQNVIDQVVQKIQTNIQSKIEKEINTKIDETVVLIINQMTENLFNDFLNREVSITDGYGDTIKCYKNVSEMIKERFDNFMTQNVDENGKTSDSRYGTKYQRVVYIIDKQLKEFANKFTSDAVKQVSEEIKHHVEEGLTNKLGTELMKVLKVNKMLGIK